MAWRPKPGPESNENGEEARLHAVLLDAAVAVRSDFRPAVLARVAALPARARPGAPFRTVAAGGRSWLVAALGALGLVALAGGAAVWASQGAGESVFSLVATLADFASTTLLTGAGLLVASWRGAGLIVREALGGSALALTAFGIVVAAVNYLVVRAWRAAPVRQRSDKER